MTHIQQNLTASPLGKSILTLGSISGKHRLPIPTRMIVGIIKAYFVGSKNVTYQALKSHEKQKIVSYLFPNSLKLQDQT